MKQNIVNILNTLTFKDSDLKLSWVGAARSENKDTLKYRFHHHAFYEIHFTTDGSVTYGFRDKEITVFKNQFIIIPKECEHKVLKHSYDFGKLTLAIEEFNTLYPFNETIKNTEEMTLLLEYIFLLSSKKPFNSSAVHFSFLALLSLLSKLTEQADEIDLRVVKAKKLIDDNFDILFTADEVARYCHLSTKQLNRLFIKFEGITILDYIHRQKLEFSKKLLTETDLSITEIALKAGFSSPGYFNKFFKNYTGISPSKYKNKTF